MGGPVGDGLGNAHSKSARDILQSPSVLIVLHHAAVDEKASITAHIKIIEWIHSIVQNADAYNGAE